MNIVSKLDNFNINNVFFLDPIENTVIDNSIFIKLIYSDPNISFNGIFLLCSFNNLTYEKIYSKININWIKTVYNSEIEDRIINIEKILLESYKSEKKKVFLIKEFIKKRNIKIFAEQNKNYVNNSILLRISGIWENETEYGIAYKFLDIVSI
jgi:hypothetical protein